MIRRGKAEGWLQLPAPALLPWAMLNEVSFDRVVPGNVESRGGALLAKEDLDGSDDDSRLLLTVPRDLVLSLERVQQHAKVDKDFREVLESLKEFGRASISCSDLLERVGVHSPFTDYIKSLPMERLPTFWTTIELQLLIGTTLAPAMSAKLKSLQREYDLLCSSAKHTRWYQIVQEYLDFDDWLQVDAMYRSRALDFPEIGHCMVPCVDLANHAPGDATVAIYEKNPNGDAILFLREDKQANQGDEVTITYGDEKGACEMIFSYGFLETDRDSAETLFLSLNIPDDDQFRFGKLRIADCAPGFKILDKEDGEIDWTGDYIWLLCVNEDDGLRFELARTIDGRDEEMTAFFMSTEIVGGTTQLRELLEQTELWNVYQLRAVAILQQRIFDQLKMLYTTQGEVEAIPRGVDSEINDATFNLVLELRQLEFELLEKAYEWFESKKNELVEQPEVIRYLHQNSETGGSESQDLEDFA